VTFWTQVGVGVYVVGAIAFSLYVMSGYEPPKLTWTGPPPTPKQERRARFAIATGMYITLIVGSFFWPIFVVVKAYNHLTHDDAKPED